MARHSHRSGVTGRWAVADQEGREMTDSQPGHQLQRPEQGTTTFSTGEYAADANWASATSPEAQQAAVERARVRSMGEQHRMALERQPAPQHGPGPQQDREVSGRLPDTKMYPESAVHAGIQAAAKSAHARGYEMGQQHAAGTPAPARAAGRVFGGRDVGQDMTSLAQEETE
jgi:hypothetical protein